MWRVLHLFVDPEVDGIAGGWQALEAALRRQGVISHFAVTPDWQIRLGGLEVPCTVLPKSRSWNVRMYRDWLRVVRHTSPDLVQVWGPRGLSWALASRALHRQLPHLLVDDSGMAASGWYRRLLRVADAVVVASESQKRAYVAAAARGTAIVVIPPTIPPSEPPKVPDVADIRRQAQLPEASRLILTAGPLEPGFGMREAVWIFDILKYTDPSLWFVVVGDGSLRRSLEDFARSLGRDDVRVRFVGWQDDIMAWLRAAEMVWLPGHRGGVGLLRAAAALGIPVVARQRDDLAESLPHSEMVRFIPAGDKHRWAKVSREFLSHLRPWREFERAEDPLGAAFASNQFMERWIQLYERLGRGGLSRRGSPLT